MRTTYDKTFNVIDNEPQHGKVREIVIEIDKHDVIEVLVDNFLDGNIEGTKHDVRIPTDDGYIEFNVGEVMDSDEVDDQKQLWESQFKVLRQETGG